MNDKRSDSNIFELYTLKKPPESAEIQAYYPFGISRTEEEKQAWFRVHYAEGDIDMIPYRELRKVRCPSAQVVELHCVDGVIILEGRNLTGLLVLVQDAKLRALYPFDAAQFAEPPIDEPVIIRIERHEPPK